jgi:hypothetical protein
MGAYAQASSLLDGLDAPPEGFRGQELFAAVTHTYAGRFFERSSNHLGLR